MDISGDKKYFSRFKKYFFYLAIIFIIIFGIRARTGIEIIPYSWTDQYFAAPTSFLLRHTLDFNARQPYYQLLALASILFFKSFSGLIYIQLFLGLITCLLFLLFYIKVFDFLKISGVFKDLYYLSALGLFYLLYCSNQKIEYEFYFRPENTNLFIESVLLILLIYIIKKPDNKIFKFIFFFLSFLSIFISFKLVFVCIFNVFIFLIIILIKKKPVIGVFWYLIVPFFVAFCLNNFVVSKETYGRQMYIGNKHYFDSSMLFWRNIAVINEDILVDINNVNFTKYDKNKLQMVLDYYHSSPKTYTNYVHSNMSSADNFIFGKERFDTKLISTNTLDVKDFYSYYFYKSLIKHPGEYLTKYFFEISLLYRLDTHRTNFYISSDVDFKTISLFPLNDIYIFKNINNPIVLDCYNKLILGSKNNKIITNRLNNDVFFILGVLYVPILLSFILVFIFSKSKEETYGKITCLISVYAFLMASVSAATWYLVCDRFIFEIFPLFLISEFMMTMFILYKSRSYSVNIKIEVRRV